MTAQIVQFLVAGLTLGAIYALVAFSLSLVYRTTRIMNITQGDFSMIGGMAAIYLVARSLPMPLSIVAGIALAALFGFLMERVIIRRALTKGFPLMAVVMSTISMAITLEGLAVVLWGRDSFTLPHLSGNTPLPILGAAILPQAIWILGVSVLLSLLFWAFFDRTMVGLAMRACAENRLAASLVGVNPKRITTLTFVLGAAVGAVAGILVAPIVFMSFIVGMSFTIKGSVAAIVGGMNSNAGAIVGGLAVGLAESLAAGIFPSLYKDVIALFILLVLLCVRPQGILRGSSS